MLHMFLDVAKWLEYFEDTLLVENTLLKHFKVWYTTDIQKEVNI